METKVEVLEGNRAKVTVTIDEKVVTDRIKKQYKEYANGYNFPGFRRGKAPRPVIDSMLGKDAVAAAVTDALVNETYPLALDESGLYPIGQPDFDEETVKLVVDKQAYTYDFEIDTKPTPELSSYDAVAIEMPSEEVTDDQVDDELDALLDHYYEVVEAPANTKVKEDKFVDMKVSATDDNGEPIEQLASESTQYGIGSGLYPKSFDDELIGLKKGDTKQFTIDVPSTPTAMTATLQGKTTQINFDIEILQVKKKKLPELTDEWVKEKIGVESVEELRSELAEEIQSQVSSMLPRLKESRVLAALSARLEGEIPESVVEDAEASLLQDFFNQLQRQGMTLDAYLQQQGISSQQFRDDVKQQAAEMAKQDLALDAYAAHAGIVATEDEILDEFEKSGANDPQGLMKQWRESGQMYLVRQGILRQKAAAELVENALVTEELPEKEEPKTGKHAKEEAAEEADEPAAEEAVEPAAEEAAE